MGPRGMREAYLASAAALRHPSLVSQAAMPDLHRLLLLCPYFLPLLSVLLRALAANRAPEPPSVAH